MRPVFTPSQASDKDQDLARRVEEHFEKNPVINGELASVTGIYIQGNDVEISYKHGHQELHTSYNANYF